MRYWWSVIINPLPSVGLLEILSGDVRSSSWSWCWWYCSRHRNLCVNRNDMMSENAACFLSSWTLSNNSAFLLALLRHIVSTRVQRKPENGRRYAPLLWIRRLTSTPRGIVRMCISDLGWSLFSWNPFRLIPLASIRAAFDLSYIKDWYLLCTQARYIHVFPPVSRQRTHDSTKDSLYRFQLFRTQH